MFHVRHRNYFTIQSKWRKKKRNQFQIFSQSHTFLIRPVTTNALHTISVQILFLFFFFTFVYLRFSMSMPSCNIYIYIHTYIHHHMCHCTRNFTLFFCYKEKRIWIWSFFFYCCLLFRRTISGNISVIEMKWKYVLLLLFFCRLA